MRIKELKRRGGRARGQVVHAHRELLEVRHASVHLSNQRRQRATAAERAQPERLRSRLAPLTVKYT